MVGTFGRNHITRLFFGGLVWLAACAPAKPATLMLAAAPSDVPSEAPRGAAVALVAPAARAPEPGTAVPVGPGDPAWGDPLAPVTMVIWGDYECPFTSRLMATLEMLKAKYGPDRLRVVWKHNPLPFHRYAKPAHIAAETVLRLGGPKAFWKFHDLAFANQRGLTVEAFEAWAVESGVDRMKFRLAIEQGTYARAIEQDIAAGRSIGVSGTPASFVNGVRLPGALPLPRFESTIDDELQKAEALLHEGVPAERIYAVLSEKNYTAEPPPAPEPPPDPTVWRVPIDGSPVRGNAAALVTMVMFGDFACPFCKRSVATIAELQKKYGDKLRVVFKHNPLPMHPRAEPAAELAIEAGAQKGDAAFWKAFDAIYEDVEHLEEPDLVARAEKLGLDVARVKKALASHRHQARIERDQDLADDLEATGTPHFFINGRRLVGAQAKEKFEALIDEEMGIAATMVAIGTPAAKIYDLNQKEAKVGKPQERLVLPAPTKDNPGKGAPLGAPVVVQVFADFQCPFCKREQKELDALVAAHPGKLRVVWRHLPLAPIHPEAEIAAEASVEAFRQKGEAGFWAFAALLWEDQTELGLGRAALLKKAAAAGLDVRKLSAELDAGTHRAAVTADVELARRLGITGTPTIIINDYYVGGAQPFRKLERVVKKALGPHEPIAEGSLHKASGEPSAATGSTPSVRPQIPAGHLGAKHLIVMYAGSRRAPTSITRTKTEARARAEEARKRLLAGASFADVVAMYSDEPGAATRGGDLGTFPKGAMVKPFEAALENLAVGQTSEIVETDFGFHIIVRTH